VRSVQVGVCKMDTSSCSLKESLMMICIIEGVWRLRTSSHVDEAAHHSGLNKSTAVISTRGRV